MMHPSLSQTDHVLPFPLSHIFMFLFSEIFQGYQTAHMHNWNQVSFFIKVWNLFQCLWISHLLLSCYWKMWLCSLRPVRFEFFWVSKDGSPIHLRYVPNESQHVKGRPSVPVRTALSEWLQHVVHVKSYIDLRINSKIYSHLYLIHLIPCMNCVCTK